MSAGTSLNAQAEGAFDAPHAEARRRALPVLRARRDLRPRPRERAPGRRDRARQGQPLEAREHARAILPSCPARRSASRSGPTPPRTPGSITRSSTRSPSSRSKVPWRADVWLRLGRAGPAHRVAGAREALERAAVAPDERDVARAWRCSIWPISISRAGDPARALRWLDRIPRAAHGGARSRGVALRRAECALARGDSRRPRIEARRRGCRRGPPSTAARPSCKARLALAAGQPATALDLALRAFILETDGAGSCSPRWSRSSQRRGGGRSRAARGRRRARASTSPRGPPRSPSPRAGATTRGGRSRAASARAIAAPPRRCSRSPPRRATSTRSHALARARSGASCPRRSRPSARPPCSPTRGHASARRSIGSIARRAATSRAGPASCAARSSRAGSRRRRRRADAPPPAALARAAPRAAARRARARSARSASSAIEALAVERERPAARRPWSASSTRARARSSTRCSARTSRRPACCRRRRRCTGSRGRPIRSRASWCAARPIAWCRTPSSRRRCAPLRGRGRAGAARLHLRADRAAQARRDPRHAGLQRARSRITSRPRARRSTRPTSPSGCSTRRTR